MRFALVIALLVPAVALAESRRVGDVVIDLPPDYELDGFSERGKGDVVVAAYRHEDWIDRDDLHTVWLASGDEVRTDTGLREWARAKVDAALDSDEFVGELKWQQTAGPGGLTVHLGVGPQVDEDGDPRRLLAVAALASGGKGTVLWVHERRDDFPAAAQAMAGLIERLGFASQGARVSIPDARPGPFDGLYWGAHLQLTPGLGGDLNTDMRHVSYTFRPDGTFFDGVPPGGVDAFDYETLADSHTPDVGRYFVNGTGDDAVTLWYADGSRDTIDLDDDGDLFDRTSLMKVRTLPPGQRLAAVRSTISYTSLPAGVGESSGVSSSSQTELRPDGTFGREGFVSASGSFDSGFGYTTRSESQRSGTYETRPGELVLRYDDGRVTRFSAFLAGDGPDATLWIGGQPIKEYELSAAPAANPLDAPTSVNPTNPLDTPANPLDLP